MEVATKERPILFSGPMVRALLDGRKTQTRRVVKPHPREDATGVHFPWASFFPGHVHTWDRNGIGGENWNTMKHLGEDKYAEALRRTPYTDPCPYGAPGDRLWVKETWCKTANNVLYRASCADDRPSANTDDWDAPDIDRWKPSIHMSRKQSRITLEVVSVRVERVQDISAKDIIAEGVVQRPHEVEGLGKCPVSAFDGVCYPDLRSLWAAGWIGINGAESWKRNDWVWVVEFKRITPARD